MRAAAYFWRMMSTYRKRFEAFLHTASVRRLYILRHEPRFFFAALALLLLPIWATEGWYSFDGPAHLYNAEVIGELLWGEGSEFLNSYYQFRWPPPPNLLYYVVTTPLTRFLAPEWTDKLWASLHVIIFVLGFRFFLRQLSGGNRHSDTGILVAFASWVGLYGVFHRHFFLGQYNFSISIGILWWTLGYCWSWLAGCMSLDSEVTLDKSQTGMKSVPGDTSMAGEVHVVANAPGTQWSLLRIGGLLTLLGISHLVGFAAAGISIAAMLLWISRFRLQRMLKPTLQLLVVSLPALAINLYYLWQSSGTGPTRHISKRDLIWQWLRLDAFTSFNPPVEWRTMVGVFLIGLLTLPLSIFALVGKKQRTVDGIQSNRNGWGYLLICSGLFFMLYCFLPDESRNSGYLSSRLAVIGQLLWLSAGCMLLGVLPRYARWLVVAVLLCLLPFRVAYYLKVERSLGRELAEFRESAQHIPPGTVVHQVNFSDNWLHEHLSMSVSGKYIIHLKNYEAYLDYFPLGWRAESIQPWLTHAQYWKNWPPCPDSVEFTRLSMAPMPDYLILWDHPESAENVHISKDVCRSALMDWLRTHYSCAHTSTKLRMRLMKRRSPAESGIDVTPYATSMSSAPRSRGSSK